jgi:predicted dehydrogenase
MVGYVRRFDAVIEAKRLLDGRRIGRLRAIATLFQLALPRAFHRVAELEPEPAGVSAPAGPEPDDLLPADQIVSQSLHHVNLIRFLRGEVRSVAGVRVRPDDAHLLLDLEGGIIASHRHAGRSGHGEELWLHGEDGMIHARLWSPHIPCRFSELALFDRAKAEETRRPIPFGNPYQAEIGAFGALVRGGSSNPCPPTDPLRDLEVIRRIHEAAKRLPRLGIDSPTEVEALRQGSL